MTRSDQSRESATSEDAGLGQAGIRTSRPNSTEDAINAEATAIDGGKEAALSNASETTVTRVPIERHIVCRAAGPESCWRS